MKNNISALRKAAGFSQAELAAAIGLHVTNLNRIERGKSAPKDIATFERIAEVLGVDPAELFATGVQSAPLANQAPDRLPYAGTVQAGVFVDVDLHTNDHPKTVAIAPDPRYRRAKQYAWLVRGDSMDRAGLLDGMWAVGVDYVDFADLYRDLESGDVVVVERLRFDGQERELTIKRFWREKDGIALVPDSSNPAHKAIVIPKDGEIVGEQIRILAYVTGAYTLFGKPVRDLDEG